MEQTQQQQPQTYSREEYAKADFWDDRYKENQGYFDWYAQYPELKDTFENQYGMKKDHNILMVGCGNSKVSEQMYQAGYKHIVNIDISPVVIQQMKKNTEGMDMEWLVMDATAMSFPDNHFDCIIDKGTMDALISGKDLTPAEKMIWQCIRVMKKNGQLLLITYGSPQGRKRVYQQAIGFQKFDYQFCKVDLNETSTLINLMRSNLGGKPLNQIMTEKKALQKSMLQYHFIQALRKKRKNQKFFIGRGKFQKKQVKFNEEQQPAKSQEKVQKQGQQASKNQQQQVKQQQKQQPKPKVIHQYTPKKQTYCYVYSIRHKFGWDLKQKIAQFAEKSDEQLLKVINGATTSQKEVVIEGEGNNTINLVVSNQVKKEILLSLKYLQLSDKQTNKVILSNVVSTTPCDWVIKINNNSQIKNQIYVNKKSYIQFAVERTETSKLAAFQTFMDHFSKQICQQFGLHPHPSIYASFQRLANNKGTSQSLRKFWYPSWKYSSITADSLSVKISLPPTANLDNIKKIITTKLRSRKIKLLGEAQGYCRVIPSMQLISLLNVGNLSFNDGQKLDLIIQQYSEDHSDYIKQEEDLLTVNIGQNIGSVLLPVLMGKAIQ